MRFSEPHSPLVSAGNYSRYTTVHEGDVRALKPDGIFVPLLLGGSVICIIGLVLASWSISMIVSNKQMQMSDDPCPGDWGDALELGDGTVYCSAENWAYLDVYKIEQIDVAENHFRITYDDRTTEYRWESIGHKAGLVAIGEIYDDGSMGCNFFFAENELPEGYGTNELYLGGNSDTLLPSWCFTSSNDNIEYSSDEQHPFLGVRIFRPMWDGFDSELVFDITTNKTMEHGYYPSSEMVETAIEEEIILGVILTFVALYILLKADLRRPVLKFDFEGRRMSMRRSMKSTRFGGWSWKNVNFSSAMLIQEPNAVVLRMKIAGEERLIASFIGESAGDYIESLKAMLNISNEKVMDAERYDGMPTLDMFDVSHWDSDNDARHIYEYYLAKIGSASHAKTLDELYQGAGIESLADRVDAQKLLNQVIEELDPEFEAQEIIVNETRVVEYESPTETGEIATPPPSVNTPSDSMQLDAFWTQDDSEGN
ncbi:MAG: hypothetical protein VXW36_05430 [Candidatus Thermoplasmatota archaeon]|nr:hypothetical protein [Candidatus Thermoplasmatota archaeon]